MGLKFISGQVRSFGGLTLIAMISISHLGLTRLRSGCRPHGLRLHVCPVSIRIAPGAFHIFGFGQSGMQRQYLLMASTQSAM